MVFAVVSIAIVAGAVGLGYYLTLPKPIMLYNFHGAELEFRDDLRAAQNVYLFPDEEAILDAVWNPELSNIVIAFIDSPDNNLVAVNSFELTYKLNSAYIALSRSVSFNGVPILSFEDLVSSEKVLVIALVPPYLANETKVELKDGVVYIHGKTLEEFDRATIKFLMAALDIDI